MTPQISPSHIAVLVPSVRRAADRLHHLGFQIGKEEEWDSEGTREIYVEREMGNSFLLIEPIQPGPYQRAMEKRGPGLHHLAIDVSDLDAFLNSIASSGWLLHPISLKTLQQNQTAYLARPGFPALIEVHERKEIPSRPLFVTEILLPMDQSFGKLAKPIGLDGIVRPTSGDPILSLAGKKVSLKELLQ